MLPETAWRCFEQLRAIEARSRAPSRAVKHQQTAYNTYRNCPKLSATASWKLHKAALGSFLLLGVWARIRVRVVLRAGGAERVHGVRREGPDEGQGPVDEGRPGGEVEAVPQEPQAGGVVEAVDLEGP
eukprot:1289683-Alexandrium_andersonii.AAC.2